MSILFISMMQVKQISDNEIYLLIKYIKSVLWRVAKCLSYIEEARCLKVNYHHVYKSTKNIITCHMDYQGPLNWRSN